ncbi:MAG: metallophosphoesterase [Proteobacteria bacterium]|nr:metallophosphoesterase [Pseudomonadota bacterium]
MRRIAFLIIFVTLLGCESKSVWDQRFKESVKLSQPTLSVGLADPNTFTFAMVGDLHIGGSDATRFRNLLQAAQAEGDSFIVLLGDIADKGEAESFLAAQNALKDFGYENKVIPILGNHDIFGNGWTEYQKIWGASHYSVDIGNSRFIALDTADGIVGEDQFEWLVDELERSPNSHTFILSHYMPVVPGQQTYLRLANQLEAERVMNLASKKSVSGFYGGHYHSFCQERIAGVDYVVAGGGGGRRMKPVEDYFFVQVSVSATGVQTQLKIIP